MTSHSGTAHGTDNGMNRRGEAVEYSAAGAWGVVALIVAVFALFFVTALATYARLYGWW